MEIPIFRTHYSIGKSILTLDSADTIAPDKSDSVFSLAKERGLKTVFVADDSPTGFISAIKNSRASGVKVRLGLRLRICADTAAEKRDDESKIIIWAKNDAGYHGLYRIYSRAATLENATHPVISYADLKSFWSNESLSMTIPFYDSFLHLNSLYGALCMPELDFAEPRLQVESNSLPFNYLIENSINRWRNLKDWPIIRTRTICYRAKSDYEAFLAARCLHERTTLEQPELPHCGSNEFCIESLKAQ